MPTRKQMRAMAAPTVLCSKRICGIVNYDINRHTSGGSATAGISTGDDGGATCGGSKVRNGGGGGSCARC